MKSVYSACCWFGGSLFDSMWCLYYGEEVKKAHPNIVSDARKKILNPSISLHAYHVYVSYSLKLLFIVDKSTRQMYSQCTTFFYRELFDFIFNLHCFGIVRARVHARVCLCVCVWCVQTGWFYANGESRWGASCAIWIFEMLVNLFHLPFERKNRNRIGACILDLWIELP